jgi:hypothetical protein
MRQAEMAAISALLGALTLFPPRHFGKNRQIPLDVFSGSSIC